MSVNKTIIIGRMGNDPEANTTKGGKSMSKFSVAVPKKMAETTKTTWFNVICFNRVAELCNQYRKKGEQVYVEGEMECNEHEGKRYWNLIAHRVISFSQMTKSNDEYSEPAY